MLNKVEIQEIVICTDNTTYLTHNFHSFPGKFIPQVPNYLISNFSEPGSTIFDPFCGSGTTLVETKLMGRNAIGVDIHPLGILISRVKTTKIPENELYEIPQILSMIEARIDRFFGLPKQPSLFEHISSSVAQPKDSFSFTIPVFPNRDHWFQKHILSELSIIHSAITQADISSRLRDFLFLAFSAIIVPVSNQDSDTRYTAIKKSVPCKRAFALFRGKSLDMLNRIKDYNQMASDSSVELYHADTRYLDIIGDDRADMIVTSPPYPNTYDYYLYHKLRMFWLGLNWEQAKFNEIGSRLRHSSQKEGVDSYINDMTKCFNQFHRILKPSGIFAIIIGDSIIRGQRLEGDIIVEELAARTGFKVEDKTKYDQSYASKAFNPAFRSKFKEEHILVLSSHQ